MSDGDLNNGIEVVLALRRRNMSCWSTVMDKVKKWTDPKFYGGDVQRRYLWVTASPGKNGIENDPVQITN